MGEATGATVATCGREMRKLSPALATTEAMDLATEAMDLVMDLATEAMAMVATFGRGMLRLSPALVTMEVMVVMDLVMDWATEEDKKRVQQLRRPRQKLVVKEDKGAKFDPRKYVK